MVICYNLKGVDLVFLSVFSLFLFSFLQIIGTTTTYIIVRQSLSVYAVMLFIIKASDLCRRAELWCCYVTIGWLWVYSPPVCPSKWLGTLLGPGASINNRHFHSGHIATSQHYNRASHKNQHTFSFFSGCSAFSAAVEKEYLHFSTCQYRYQVLNAANTHSIACFLEHRGTATSFTSVQTQILENCPIHMQLVLALYYRHLFY